LKKFSEIDTESCKRISVVATDVDGTITFDGRITEQTIRALTTLHNSGLKTVLVTGRSAGCGLTLLTYLPGLTGVIAENGGVVIEEERVVWVHARTQKLAGAFGSLFDLFPDLNEGNDNFSRLSDYTIDMRSIKNGELKKIAEHIHKQRLNITHSSVHAHLYDGDYSKGTALRSWLNKRGINTDSVFTIGDSANDESLVNVGDFPHSCWVGTVGVADVLGLRPAYITSEIEGAGFEEIANTLSFARR
jgi:hydroxymethylpyrimidine pyrophosphatase-like HAD family hydrolase